MDIRFNNTKKNRDIKHYIIAIVGIFSLIIFLPFIAKASSSMNSDKDNLFYVQVINNSMALVKGTVFDERDLEEGSFSIKKEILKCFNITSNPTSILEKEIACIETGNSSEMNITFNPFKLSNKSISVYDDKKDNNSNKTVNIYNPKLKKTLNKAKPEVFIYHTHTTESFKPEEKFSMDHDKNVCEIGDVIVNELENNYGISVVHDKTVHDVAYTGSYQRSGETVNRYLKKYGDFKLLIDLHRDSVDNKSAFTIKLNGENVAKYMFVIAKNNPHFKSNMMHVNDMIQISNKLYPKLCRGVLYYERGACASNQKKSNNSILIELGSYVNTLDEAKRTGKYLSRVIAEHLNGKK